MTRRRAALAGLVVVAILLRIGAIAYTHATTAPAEENRIIARNLADGRGFTFTEFGVTGPTAIRGPAYPMLLALLGPDRVALALAVNVIVGGATVVAAFALLRRLASSNGRSGSLSRYGRERVRVRASDGGLHRSASQSTPESPPSKPSPYPLPAIPGEGKFRVVPWIAAALFAVWPTQIYAATLTQGLSIAVLLTLTSLTVAFRRTPLTSLAGGALAGLVALIEPTLALPLLLLSLAIGRRRHWSSAAIYVAAAGVIVAPWLYRNAIVFDRPMPITSNFWRDMFAANGPDLIGDHPTTAGFEMRGDTVVEKPRVRLLPPADFDQLKRPEAERGDVFRRLTWDWISRHPSHYFKRCATRVGVILTAGYDNRLARFAGGYLPFIAVTAWGLLNCAAELRRVVVLTAVGLVLPMVLVIADARMLPLLDVPLLLACAGVYPVRRHRPKAAT